MFSNVLIIDKRKELSTKYKKILESSQISVMVARNLKDGLCAVEKFIPDVIIISDSIEESLVDFCARIRVLTYNFRPVIVALSKSADINDRIKVLENGADDFLSEPVNIEEFKFRIIAHLRRDVESNLDNKTLLPNKKCVTKILNRILNLKLEKTALLLLSIERLKEYVSLYSEVAGDKIIQTLVAIIKSATSDSDFIGQLSDTDLIIITNSNNAEQMAAFLTFAFDTVIPKFYSEKDSSRGYMLLKGDRLAEMRINFVSLLIGGLLDLDLTTKTVEGLLEKLYSLKDYARIPSGSNYLIERIKLAGENSVCESKKNDKIYIKEDDAALSLLIRTTLELQGYDIETNFDVNNSEQPRIIILDVLDDLSGLEVCKNLKQRANFINTKIIVTTSLHDKNAVLNAGADLYLPKPYEISDLIRWVEYFYNE